MKWNEKERKKEYVWVVTFYYYCYYYYYCCCWKIVVSSVCVCLYGYVFFGVELVEVKNLKTKKKFLFLKNVKNFNFKKKKNKKTKREKGYLYCMLYVIVCMYSMYVWPQQWQEEEKYMCGCVLRNFYNRRQEKEEDVYHHWFCVIIAD